MELNAKIATPTCVHYHISVALHYMLSEIEPLTWKFWVGCLHGIMKQILYEKGVAFLI